jgi:hypothetical protein
MKLSSQIWASDEIWDKSILIQIGRWKKLQNSFLSITLGNNHGSTLNFLTPTINVFLKNNIFLHSKRKQERPGNQPEWGIICEKFKDFLAPIETRAWLADLVEDVKRLAETMRKCHVDEDIIQRLAGWIDEVAAGLVEIRPGK